MNIVGHSEEEPYATGVGRIEEGEEALYYIVFLPYYFDALFYLTNLEFGHGCGWQHEMRQRHVDEGRRDRDRLLRGPAQMQALRRLPVVWRFPV